MQYSYIRYALKKKKKKTYYIFVGRYYQLFTDIVNVTEWSKH